MLLMLTQLTPICCLEKCGEVAVSLEESLARDSNKCHIPACVLGWKDPEMDDYQKLMRMMKYLHGTKSLPLTLKANESGSINW
jgi:hypothetical protein